MAFPSIFSTYFDVSLLEIGTSSIFLVLFNLKVAMASTLVIRDLLRTLLKQNTALLSTFRMLVSHRRDTLTTLTTLITWTT